ncbi:MAG: MFS transporter [Mycobacteriaceae bacterium]|nr:MFS transporter [Mycobacteriaceae bacterium]
MTILAAGLGDAAATADPTILSTNLAAVRASMGLSISGASFVTGLATITLAASVLGAGALGDLYGKKRMYVYGLLGTIAFGLLAAAAPNSVVLMVARAGSGIAFAFLFGLSLAIVNSVFAPEHRKTAIALFFAAGFAITAPMPALGSWLAGQIGWRNCFLIAPAIATLSVLVTVKYVPEPPRSQRKLDLAGLILVAIALLGVVYGVSQLQNGFTALSLIPILVGLLAGIGFLFFELRTPQPALDLRIFGSRSFNTAVIAGVTWDFLTGGSTIVFAFYLVIIRGEAPEVLGLLLLPVMALQALAATGSGRAAIRFGERTVLIAGLLVLLAGLLVLTLLHENTPLFVLFIAVFLNFIGSAIVQTPQATIMMASAPAELSGAVSAVKASLGQAGYSLGPALFATVGTWFYVRDRDRKLADMGITLEQARQAFRVNHGGNAVAAHAAQAINPQLAREVVAAAEQYMLSAIHTVAFIMAVVPVLAIITALVLLPGKPSTTQQLSP